MTQHVRNGKVARARRQASAHAREEAYDGSRPSKKQLARVIPIEEGKKIRRRKTK